MRARLLSTTMLLAGLSGGITVTAAGQAAAKTTTVHDASLSDAVLIANALSAAPASVAAGATVMGHDGRVLRKGTTDWVCMPDIPNLPNDSPMCLDAQVRAVVTAWVNKRDITVTQVGFGYALQDGWPVSNTDPFAAVPTATNQWLQNSGPHVIVVLPDHRLLEGVSTDPTNGGPYVMWKGTPYAHIMVPAPRAAKKQ